MIIIEMEKIKKIYTVVIILKMINDRRHQSTGNEEILRKPCLGAIIQK